MGISCKKNRKNESAKSCLIIEIFEELSLEITQIRKLNETLCKHSEDRVIKRIPFVCEILKGEIKLTEHANYLWLDKANSQDLNWAEADLPILKEVLNIEL